MLEFLKAIEKCIIIVGDTNIRMLTSDYRKKKLNEIMSMFGLHSALSLSTRYGENSYSSVDKILTNIPQTSYLTIIHITFLSDHYGTSISFSLGQYKRKAECKYSRVFSLCRHSYTI